MVRLLTLVYTKGVPTCLLLLPLLISAHECIVVVHEMIRRQTNLVCFVESKDNLQTVRRAALAHS